LGEIFDASFDLLRAWKNRIMSEITSLQAPESTRQGQPPSNIVVATLLTMGVVFAISDLSFFTSVSLGSFAGFCIAAWNWFRMGRRRKALVHVLLGLGVYLLFQVGFVLLTVLLVQVFPPSQPVETEINIPGVTLPGARMLSSPQTSSMIPLLLIAYCLIVGVLVLLYLYRATAHDVTPTEPLDDNSELKRFLPLLAVAGISAATVVATNILISQIHITQMQNHVYCELLHPGMTFEEAEGALNEIGPHRQVWFQDVPYPTLSEQASFYRAVYWDNYRLDRDYDLSLWLGYDENDQLVWRGRYWLNPNKKSLEESFDTIECPWTFSQSVTAR
jgi:hypothetical protein